MLQTLVRGFRRSEYAPLLLAVALELSVMAGLSSAGQDPRPSTSIIGFTEDEVQTLLGPPSLTTSSGTTVWYYDGTTRGTVRVEFVGGKVVRMSPAGMLQELQRSAADKRRTGWKPPAIIRAVSDTGADSVAGWTEGQIQATFGAPSLEQRNPDGSVVWYYDGTSKGTAKVSFAAGKVVRVLPDGVVKELAGRAKASTAPLAHSPAAELATASAVPQSPQDQSTQLQRQTCARGDPSVSAAACTQLLEQGGLDDESKAVVYVNRGNAYDNLDDPDRAIKDYDAALAINPRSAVARRNKGAALNRQGRLREALQEFEASISLQPDYALAYGSRADNLRAQADLATGSSERQSFLERAIVDYDKMIELGGADHLALALEHRGMTNYSLRRVVVSITDFTKAIELGPAFRVYVARAIAYADIGDFTHAGADVEKASALVTDLALADALHEARDYIAQRRRSGSQIPQPRKTKDVPPVYPEDARQARIQGDVVVEATIGSDGRVQETRVVQSIPQLDQAAIDAVRQWQFAPTLLNGQPAPVTATVTVRFRLQSQPDVPKK